MLVADDRPVQRYSADWLRIEKQEMVLGVALRFNQHFRVEVSDFTWFHNRNPHAYHLGFQHVKDIWIWEILDNIGRIHFFGFMLVVDQLNGCLCLSMESTWPLQGWLCPNLQPGDEDFRYFLNVFSCIFHISKDLSWEISFGWGTDASFSSQDWDWTGRSQIYSEGTYAYSLRKKMRIPARSDKKQLRFISHDV